MYIVNKKANENHTSNGTLTLNTTKQCHSFYVIAECHFKFVPPDLYYLLKLSTHFKLGHQGQLALLSPGRRKLQTVKLWSDWRHFYRNCGMDSERTH